jgi:hypothetical protein
MGTLAARRPSVFSHDARENGEDPSLDRTPSAGKIVETELRKAPMRDQEHVLYDIVDCGIVHPEPAGSSPDELNMCVIEVFEGFGSRGNRSFREITVSRG